MDEYFVVDVQQTALFADGSYMHHSLTSPVLKQKEIYDRFNVIASAKGEYG